MSVYYFSAAAGGAVGDNCAVSPWNRRNFPRVITGVGFCGGAAAGDGEVELLVNGFSWGKFKNLATGFPTKDHIIPTRTPIPANAEIEIKITDVPATNAGNGIIIFTP